MARRSTLDDKLAAVRAWRDRPESAELIADLRKALKDKSNFIAATAAEIVGERLLLELASDLEAAFHRFLIDPVKTDKLCRAKLAAVEALEKLEHPGDDLFLKAARHVQMEPVWGREEDTAPPLRAAGLVGLTRVNPPGLSTILVDALTDPEREVRIAAALALGAVGSEAAALVLRLKCRLGDKEPEVLSECLHGLLIASSKEHMGFVVEFLNPDSPVGCEAAVLALGKSRLPEALEPLRRCWDRERSASLRETILLAVAMLRASDAIDFLLDLVTEGPEDSARMALSALKIHRHDPKLVERARRAALQSGNRATQGWFESGFRSTPSS